MPHRVREILLVSSAYDAFILEEDGPLTERLFTEYSEVNLSSAARITHVESGGAALRLLEERRFDLVLAMPRLVGTDAVTLARQAKERQPGLPVVVLTFNEADLRHIPGGVDNEAIDNAYMWTGDARILITIAKLVEDFKNIDHDTKTAGVPMILVVEDSIRYASSFLTALYAELMQQSQSLVADGVSRLHKLYQMRTRLKVRHERTFEQANDCVDQLGEHIVAVITDISFPRQGAIDREAGFRLVERIRREWPSIPILMQSADPETEARADGYGAVWINKRSPNLLRDLRHFVSESLGFGPFVFRLPDRTEVARANDLHDMEQILATIPAESVRYHANRHDFSVWFAARGRLEVSHLVRARDFKNAASTRRFLLDTLHRIAAEEREGTIADFSAAQPLPDTAMARVGEGSIGGKARGIAFVNTVLVQRDLLDRFTGLRIQIPKTAVLATEAFQHFVEDNEIREDLEELADDNAIIQRFLAGRLPEGLERDLHEVWKNLRGPLAIRSSGLLEDLQFQPFSGVYATYMLPNNHPDPDKRFRQFCRAIRAVYASTYSEGARAYIENTPYRLEEERMAVIIQELVGEQHGERFYPHASGVALSHNYYPIRAQRSQDGMVCMALGLGHQIVAGGTVLRFSPATPGVLAQFATAADYLRNTQNRFYALDTSRPVIDFLAGPTSSLALFDLSDAERDGMLTMAGSVYCGEDDVIRENLRLAGPRVVSFNNILKWNAMPLAAALRELLRVLSKGMGCPVEIEFAVGAGDYGRSPPAGEAARPPTLYVLQIRPLATHFAEPAVETNGVRDDEVLCWTDRALGQGVIDDIYDLVYVKPDALEGHTTKEIAAQVGELNASLQRSRVPFLLIGPGRWGTSDPSLGLPVEWRQIAGARVIAETPLRGEEVEPSQGSHFFHNITSRGVGYLTLGSAHSSAGNRSGGYLDLLWLEGTPAHQETTAVRHLRFSEPLRIVLDGRRGTAMVVKPRSLS